MSDQEQPGNRRQLKPAGQDADSPFVVPPPKKAPKPQQKSDGPAPAPWETNPNTWMPPSHLNRQQTERTYQSGSVMAPSTAGRAYESFEIDDPGGRSAMWAWIGWGLAAVALIALLIYEIVPATVPAPSGYTRYTSPDSRFVCAVPAGWSIKSTPASNPDVDEVGGALFRQGPAKIDVTTDSIGDFKAALVMTSNDPAPPALTSGDPTPTFHEMQKGSTRVAFKDYQEQKPVNRPTGIGYALVSEFTGKGGFFGLGGPIHGYRMSVCDAGNTFEVVFQCPEKSRTTLKGAFDYVIASFDAPQSAAPSAPAPTTDFGSAGHPVESSPSGDGSQPPSASPDGYGATNPAGATGYGGDNSDGGM